MIRVFIRLCALYVLVCSCPIAMYLPIDLITMICLVSDTCSYQLVRNFTQFVYIVSIAFDSICTTLRYTHTVNWVKFAVLLIINGCKIINL